MKKDKTKRDKILRNNIKMFLDKKGMSQQELCDIALKGNASFLSKIINGKKEHISLCVALKIAKTLNEPVTEVFIFE